MLKTAEAVSIGHPDKTADYISSYILDRFIEQETDVHYAVEVMVKGNTVILGGEIASHHPLSDLTKYVKQALREIGYDERYHEIWQDKALDIHQIKVINLIGMQSLEINQGVTQDGWGDQGVFVGYACQGEGHINPELFWAKKLNQALYEKARQSTNLGLDIKTQITLDDRGHITTAIVAIPMIKQERLDDFIVQILKQKPDEIIVNGTGIYQTHSSVADCGITGRKLACDFYSTACPIGGGSPWTKDATKADLTLNLYARRLALENLQNNDECFVYLSSCIGQYKLPSGTIKMVKQGNVSYKNFDCSLKPKEIIRLLGLNHPVYAELCQKGLMTD